MKKWFLIITLILVLILSYLFYSHYDNIKGLIYSFKYSTEEIENMMSENNDVFVREVEELIGYQIRPFTQQENEQIDSGAKTKEEIIEHIIMEEIEKKADISSNGNIGANNPEDSKAEKEVNTTATAKDSSYYLASLYSTKERYLGYLDNMVDSAVSEYKALESSKRTRSKKLEIGASYVKKALALEKECDAEVASILSSLEKQLKAEGKSTSIISTLNNAYKSEKNLKRAYYLNMFK